MKSKTNKSIPVALLTISVWALSACAPEVGSKQWCEEMKGKPKGDWTANQAVDFAKHCVMK